MKSLFAALLIFSALNLSSQSREDPRRFFHTLTSAENGLRGFIYRTYCYELTSGRYMSCLFSTAIKFEFPSTAIAEQAKVDWGRGHVHTGNRPIGSIASDLGTTSSDGKSIFGNTQLAEWEIRNISAPTPGAVTQNVRLKILDQPSPSDPNGPVISWHFVEQNNWLFDLNDPTGKTIELPIAIFAEYPAYGLNQIPGDAHYVNCGTCGGSPDSAEHPQKFYGTATTAQNMQLFFKKYDEDYFFLYNKHTLGTVTRISLQYGGIYDEDLSWTENPFDHLSGNAFDAPGLLINGDGTLPDKAIMDSVLSDIPFLSYTTPSASHPDYHFAN